MEFKAETTINASPETIWAILTDGGSYHEWDPNMVRLEGRVAMGEKVTAHTKLSERAFPVKVTTFEPNKKMVWSGGMPLGLFGANRSFTLTPRGEQTHFALREEFSGLLLFIMKRTIPDLTPSFEQFVAGLKQRAESS